MKHENKLISLMLDSLARFANLYLCKMLLDKDSNLESLRVEYYSLHYFESVLPQNISISDDYERIYKEKYEYYRSQSDKIINGKTSKDISRELFEIDGINDAIVFAIEADGSQVKVHEEINSRTESLKNRLELGDASIQANTSPRLYLDGYIEGLQQILSIFNEESQK